MKQIMERAIALKDKMVAWRRLIHKNPELGMNLPLTVALVTKALQEMGLEPQSLGGGVVALIQGQRQGKTILLRADMDALPMDEDSGLDFASEVKGAAHTCGHDLHTAMLLGAAQILTENRSNFSGNVKLMFQPGEEVGLGAAQMVEEGILENPKVDAALGIHTLVASDIPSGKLAFSPGPSLASSDLFRINITGKGCHGSRPEMGIDPINILCHIHTLLQSIISREKPQNEKGVLTIGQISAGSAPNIIPSEGYMTGTIRTAENEIRNLMKTRLCEIASGTATTLGGSANIEFSSELPPLSNDAVFTNEISNYLEELLGKENIVPMPFRMASEDIGAITSRVPGLFIRLSMGSVQEGYCYDGHHPKVVFNEEAMTVGAATYAYSAIRWLENN